jgi:tetratricopeptide (TPR) repeat protein
MQFDPNNHVIALCIQGMEMEGQGKPEEAAALFLKAWNEATNNFEKFTAAHYLARHQKTIVAKLHWDQTALNAALTIDDEAVKTTLPSLYLNIAKCYEDLGDFDNAAKQYQLALSFTSLLPNDGYGNMIRTGIDNGISRIIDTMGKTTKRT